MWKKHWKTTLIVLVTQAGLMEVAPIIPAVEASPPWIPGKRSQWNPLQLENPLQLGKAFQLDTTVGMPGARHEIDEFIRRVSSMDMETAYESLHDAGEDYNMGFSASNDLTEDLGPVKVFPQILADRRVAKIYAALKAMPPEQACEVVQSHFFDDLGQQQMQFSSIVEDPTQIPPPVPTNYLALSVSLFLTAEFCDAKAVLNSVDQWSTVIGPISDAAVRSDAPGMSLWGQLYGRPQPLLLVNIYLICLRGRHCLTEEDVSEARGMGMSPLLPLRFSAWNAHTNQFDFTRIHGNAPLDDAKVLKTYPSAIRWTTGMEFDPERQRKLVKFWRSRLEACIARGQTE